MSESVHEINDSNSSVMAYFENSTSNTIHIRKNSRIGTFEKLDNFEISIPSKRKVLQVNNLNLTEVRELRKQEIKECDFDLKHLEQSERRSMLKFLMDNSAVFSKSYMTLGETDKVVPDLKLLHEFPIQTRPYPIPKIAKEFAAKEISKLLEAKIIEPSTSNYSFPVLFVRKKANMNSNNSKAANYRMCVDYRLLNCVSEGFKICLPRISDILQQISGKNLYCVLDLKSAFFQIRLKDDDKHKLAFCTEFGNFQPCRLPFGAKNSTSYFHALIHKCLHEITGPNLQFFLDDIIIAGDSFSQVKTILQDVFNRLIGFNLTLDPGKLQICKSRITYLGFSIDKNGYAPSDNNVNKVLKFPIPKNQKQVQMFLGTLNYFRHLIHNYADLVAPIVNLTRKKVPFIWSQDCQESFEKLQEIILTRPTIKNIDTSLPFYLVTDASITAACGILMQKINEKFYPVEFFSKKFSDSESRYPSIRRELYAIFLAVRHFHEHLYGKKFFVLTDAKPLTFHTQLDKQSDTVARWLLYLQDFDFSVEHIPGLSNPADYLSRVILPDAVVNNIRIFERDIDNNLSIENIVKQQFEDCEIKKIKDKINKNDKRIKNDYFIDIYTKILMRRIRPDGKFHKKHLENKIVIPKSLQKTCLNLAHSPHFGYQKTYDFLKRKFFWKGMSQDVKKYCENCTRCLEHKSKSRPTVPAMIPKSKLAPGEFVAIDLVGKLPRSHDNKYFVLTVVDHYSRYLQAYTLHSSTSAAIIRQLNNYFASFGIPKIILSDNGSNFVSTEIETFFKNLKIEHRKTSIYFPRSNGLLERIHKSMKQSIAALSDQVIEWSDSLLYFQLHYNNAIHAVTKFSPAELFFGRPLNIPLESFNSVRYESEFSTFIESVKKQQQEVAEEVTVNEEQYFESHEKFCKGRRIPELELGDMVFIPEFRDTSTFEKKFSGPFEIVKKFRNHNYLINIGTNGGYKTQKLHVSKLYKQNKENN